MLVLSLPKVSWGLNDLILEMKRIFLFLWSKMVSVAWFFEDNYAGMFTKKSSGLST